jgi:branched-chain amino acid transport system substrate-binding protein
MLVADAISRSGSLDRKRVRHALAGTKGFEGATGPITFDNNGDPLNKAAAIVKWEHQHQLFLKTVNP